MASERLVILSDLHLWGPQDPLYRALLRFMQEKLSDGDKFFIVGDLFDLFIGNKSVFVHRYYEVLEALKKLAERNIEVFYIEGNHDFHLEGIFEDCSHVRIYSDHLDYEWNGRRLLFCHGDKINWKDIGYQAFRFGLRNLFTQSLIEVAPGSLIDRIGSSLSKASRGYHPEPNETVIQLFRNYACEQISNGYDFVVMGHSHYLDDMRFRVEDHEGQYINVGYPRKHRKYLELTKEDSFFRFSNWDDVVIPFRPTTAASE